MGDCPNYLDILSKHLQKIIPGAQVTSMSQSVSAGRQQINSIGSDRPYFISVRSEGTIALEISVDAFTPWTIPCKKCGETLKHYFNDRNAPTFCPQCVTATKKVDDGDSNDKK